MRFESLEKLRAEIRKIEGHTHHFESSEKSLPGQSRDNHPAATWSFGLPEIDQLLPHGLSSRALHEITPAFYKDSVASLSFALALLSLRACHDSGPLLWCSSSRHLSEFGQLYGHGLRRFNIDPRRFLVIETENETETALVLEEALKSARLCAVLGLINNPGFTAARRLSLMADRGQTPALLVTNAGKGGIRTASTCWQVTTLPALWQSGAEFSFPQPAWQVTLVRNRLGPADKNWHLEFPCYDQPFINNTRKAFCFSHPSPFRTRKSQTSKSKSKAA